MLGYVTNFDRATQKGMIYCKNDGKRVELTYFSLLSGDCVNIGDYISLPQSKKDGQPQPVTVLIPARIVPPKVTVQAQRQSSASNFSSSRLSTVTHKVPPVSSTPTDDRVLCSSCNKTMVPQLVMCDGKPNRSFCPFCAAIHRDFRHSNPPTIVENGKMMAADALATSIIGVAVMAIFGL